MRRALNFYEWTLLDGSYEMPTFSLFQMLYYSKQLIRSLANQSNFFPVGIFFVWTGEVFSSHFPPAEEKVKMPSPKKITIWFGRCSTAAVSLTFCGFCFIGKDLLQNNLQNYISVLMLGFVKKYAPVNLLCRHVIYVKKMSVFIFTEIHGGMTEKIFI